AVSSGAHQRHSHIRDRRAAQGGRMNVRHFLSVAVLAAAGLAGCSRAFYRTQADDEEYCVVDEKAYDPRWELQDFSIAPDPRARFYDPFDPDFPPMPPEDPDSHAFMHRVDGKNGYPHWHANGETQFLENPDCMKYLP